jgi:hypothetical protein
MRPETAEGAEALRKSTGIRFLVNRGIVILILKDNIRLKPARIALMAVFLFLS